VSATVLKDCATVSENVTDSRAPENNPSLPLSEVGSMYDNTVPGAITTGITTGTTSSKPDAASSADATAAAGAASSAAAGAASVLVATCHREISQTLTQNVIICFFCV